jgi:hypothetical protein
MLDTTDRANLKQLSVASFGKDTGIPQATLPKRRACWPGN